MNSPNRTDVELPIFVLGKVGSGKTEVMKRLAEDPSFHVLDVGKMYRALAYLLLEDTSPPGATDIAEQVIRSRKRLSDALGALSITGDNAVILGGTDITADLQTDKVSNVVGQIALIPLVRNLVNAKMHAIVSENAGANIVLTGHTLKEINTSKFFTVYLDIDEAEAAARIMRSGRDDFPDLQTARASIFERNNCVGASQTREQIDRVHNHVLINTADASPETVFETLMTSYNARRENRRERIDYQRHAALDRRQFTWTKHPVLEMAQRHVEDHVALHQEELETLGICPVDLLTQVLMSCSAHPVQELCHNVNGQGKRLAQLDPSASGHYVGINAYDTSGTFLNHQLVENIIRGHLERYRTQEPPYGYMNRASQSPFPQGAELTTRGCTRSNLDDDYQELCYHERLSGTPVIARPVSPEMSKMLAERYHYLHSFRDDELQAFGIFLEGEKLPFAWVSYSALDRDYKKELLEYYGVESHNVLEMTRAWSAIWAPKNTMSLLFHYSRNQMKELWKRKMKMLQADKPLSGIYTTVNPNLSFSGSSFLGASFIPVGLRPAGLQFTLENDIWVAKTRRQAKDAKQRGEAVKDNALPLLPLNEMLMLFDARQQERIAQEPIHSVSPTLYRHV